jgi:hypothetical protein
VLCIDVEPDGFFIDRRRPDPWRGFERAVEYLDAFRRRHARATNQPVRFLWAVRLDPQVAATYGTAEWPLIQYRRQVSSLVAAGDDIGAHTHAYRWRDEIDAGRGGWVLDQGDQAWIEHSVRMSLDAYHRVFDEPCRSFRFGDRWLNDATVDLLERCGIQYELTIEPGYGPQATYHPSRPHTGSLPDYRDVRAAPYRPARDDYRRPAGAGRRLWMIPMTTAPIQPSWWRRLYARARGLPMQPVSTALLSHTPALFRGVIDAALRSSVPHLAIAVRSGAFASPRLRARIDANLRTLCNRDTAGSVRWVTPAEAIAALSPAADPAPTADR